MVNDLLEMLRYRRPHGSKSERKFINRYLRPLGVREDEYGNLYLRIGDAPIMWASHTDTVHDRGGKQRLVEAEGLVAATNSSCLGADDTTGVWLMVKLARAGVPGLYVWHRAEEIGCKGSAWIAENTPELVDGIKFCLSLDRAGYNSIVTHQCGLRTASQAFADSLALQLNLNYSDDPGGVYTDSLEYCGLIPECTNLSVGYDKQHTFMETQDVGFALALLRALASIDPEFLEVDRVASWGETYDDSYESAYAHSDDDYQRWLRNLNPLTQDLIDDDIPPRGYGTARSHSGWKWDDYEWEEDRDASVKAGKGQKSAS